MVSVFAVLQVLLGAALVALVLMHSGREAGFGGIGFTPTSQGGTHIVERNLTRLTVAVAVLFGINTVVLYRLLVVAAGRGGYHPGSTRWWRNW